MDLRMWKSVQWGVVLGLALLLGCGRDDAADGTVPIDSAAVADSAAQTIVTLNDAEIAHALSAVHAAEAELAASVVDRVASGSVRTYASTLAADHQALRTETDAVAQQATITPADNAITQEMLASAQAARTRLDGLTGTELDRAYIEHEGAFHQRLLDVFDRSLIPGAQNAELRQLLVDTRPAVDAHLQRARQILATLGS